METEYRWRLLTRVKLNVSDAYVTKYVTSAKKTRAVCNHLHWNDKDVQI